MRFIEKNNPALVLAPMEGVTDSPMRALMTEIGAFTFCVSEFYRISQNVPAPTAFLKFVPELEQGAITASGVPVQVQLLGGNPERLAESALRAISVGARAIDLNFGCPAQTVNRHDGGATLLKSPERISAIVSAVRSAVPREIPVSAKLRLGWDDPRDISKNAIEANRGGADWITIHARTKSQGYKPPAHWKFIGEIQKDLSIPIVANGDIWTMDDLKRCQEETGSEHFMLGRAALADPALSLKAAEYLGLKVSRPTAGERLLSKDFDLKDSRSWLPLLERFHELCLVVTRNQNYTACRFKQWLAIVQKHGKLEWIDQVKRVWPLDDIRAILRADRSLAQPSAQQVEPLISALPQLLDSLPQVGVRGEERQSTALLA